MNTLTHQRVLLYVGNLRISAFVNEEGYEILQYWQVGKIDGYGKSIVNEVFRLKELEEPLIVDIIPDRVEALV